MYPGIPELLDPVFGLLDKETLQDLNSQVALEGKDAATVAEGFLKAEGFIE
jgi:osmoprotectant transport system substrate-binding protein